MHDDTRAGSGDQDRRPSGADTGSDRELDPEEGADAYETPSEAEENTRREAPDRRDEDEITLDTPD